MGLNTNSSVSPDADSDSTRVVVKGKNHSSEQSIVQELCESRGGRPELSVLNNEPSGFRGRKELLNRAS